MGKDSFDKERLPGNLREFLHETNPWWQDKPGPELPPYRRGAFDVVSKRMDHGLAPITVLRGPRQVGKTTLQQQLIQDRIHNRGVRAQRILRVQFDEIPSLRELKEPVLSIARWFENRILGETFNEAAHRGERAILFFDEVQNLPDWAPQVKTLVDHHTVSVLVTGSSALRIEAGRDSLAGRINQVDMGTLRLREIAGLHFGQELPALLPDNGLESILRKDFWRELQQHGLRHAEVRDAAFGAFSRRGGYPIAHLRKEVIWSEVADQLNETVIKRAIQHDLRMGERGAKRDPDLLEEVFRLACRYAGQAPGQAVFVPEIQQALDANIGWQRILQYLKFLDGAMLVRLIRPMELRLKRRKGNHKICLCDHGLRASWLQENVPIDPKQLSQAGAQADLAGHIAESVAGYFLSSLPGVDLDHFPERGAEPEVDYVITLGEKRIPIEIKYRRRIDEHRDTLGIRAFLEKTVYNAPFGILVTLADGAEVSDPRIICLSLRSLLTIK